MKTISSELARIRRELQAQKQACQVASTNLKLITKTLSFSTKENLCHSISQYGSFQYDDIERVVVTLSTPSGANTLAKLEIAGDFATIPTVRRVPYNGGARWVIASNPRRINPWGTTTYNFTVQTLVDGVLSAKMVWE